MVLFFNTSSMPCDIDLEDERECRAGNECRPSPCRLARARQPEHTDSTPFNAVTSSSKIRNHDH